MERQIAMFLALMLVFMLTACSDSASSEEPSTPSSEINVEEPEVVESFAFNAEDFYGDWKYREFDMWLEIHGDGTYLLYETEENKTEGTYHMEDDLLVLDESDNFFYLNGEGQLIDQDGDTLVIEETSSRPGSQYWGFYETPDGYLKVHSDGTFEVMFTDGEVYNSGTWKDDDGLSLFADGESVFVVLDEEGNLYGGEDVGTFKRINESDAAFNRSNGGNSSSGENKYLGFWKYSNGYILQITEYDEWNLYTEDGITMLMWGPVEYDEEAVYLMNTDGSSGGGVLSFDSNGNLTDGGEVLTYWGQFLFGGPESNQLNSFIEGEWYYSDQGSILYFDGVENYVWTIEGQEMTGTYTYDGEWVTFLTGDGAGEARLDKDSGYLYVTGDAGSYYYRSDDF